MYLARRLFVPPWVWKYRVIRVSLCETRDFLVDQYPVQCLDGQLSMLLCVLSGYWGPWGITDMLHEEIFLHRVSLKWW